MCLPFLRVGQEPPSVSRNRGGGGTRDSDTSPTGDADIPRLLEYPYDILCVIHSFLPVSSQACFALICKHLYESFHRSLKHPQLVWPNHIEETGSVAVELPEIAPRTELLLRLETPDTPFCVACLKFHRRDEFPKDLSQIPKRERTCRFGTSVVDLCHCLALTPMTGAKLRRWLRAGTAPPTLDQSILTAFRLLHEDGQLALRHSCTATDRQYGALQLHMDVRFMGSGQLVVRTRYTLGITTVGIIQGWEQLGRPVSATGLLSGCRHRNLIHVSCFGLYMEHQVCPYCHAVFHFVHHVLPTSTIEWVVCRDLGSESDHELWRLAGRPQLEERKRVKRCLQSMPM
ncbi:hypothetical protein BJY00DRAFT_315116 [Aspergillus carlsbadensis]|nr:hypothetical protein BJY00DRAFT_315116 [Aspergillus carlsbadensis]